MEIAIFAGGCFWCTEAIFRRLKGVTRVTPGYIGGAKENPSYEEVSLGQTGHAEAIKIEFDPKIITFKELLEVFFALHDPTSLNFQGADYGTQYRSAIFFQTREQEDQAKDYIARLKKQKKFPAPIVTEVVAAGKFYPAEDYHLNYFEKNKNNSYCRIVIDPKITKLYQEFSQKVN